MYLKHFHNPSIGDRTETLSAIERVPQGKAEKELKQIIKVIKSKDSPLYLLHHDLVRTSGQKDLKSTFPKLDELLRSSALEPTRLCGKRVGRLPSRGEKPTEPSDSWLPKKRT